MEQKESENNNPFYDTAYESLAEIPDISRECVFLRDCLDVDRKTTAEILGITKSQHDYYLAQGREVVRELMEGTRKPCASREQIATVQKMLEMYVP